LLYLLAVVTLVGLLAQEVALFRPDLPLVGTLPAIPFVVSVVLAIATLAGLAVTLALVSDLDPFALSERWRTVYVYLAEVLLVLLFAHLRLTAPYLFHRDMVRYWPFLVMGVAFLGAAASEVLHRKGLRILAEPLERTGILLPVVPVVAFWTQPLGNYALVWFLAGLLYGFLAITRRSLALALLALVAGNIGLWLVLQNNQLAFIEHPQLWLIPLALSILGAEALNSDRLSRGQRNALRYLALTAIYISSTAETFLLDLGRDPVRPAVLVGLSVVGVFVGMLLRVRAFLFLGAGFTFLGILGLIRHAALAAADNGPIIWLVAGIVLGVTIFTLFAVFEKRRNDVLRLLQALKEWE
jgi:hypothetical protein